MKKIIDSNILLDFPQIIEEEKELVVISDVLRELDGLKLNQNPEISFKARRAAVLLSRRLEEIEWNNNYENLKISVDDKLLKCTEELNGELITNDVYLKVKAYIKGIKTDGYRIKDSYSGVKTILIETDENGYNEWLDFVLENKKFPDEREAFNNEYYLVKDTSSKVHGKNDQEDYEVLTILVNKEGKILPLGRKEVISNTWINKIVPKNPEQECLFNALNDKKISIIYAGGKFGTG